MDKERFSLLLLEPHEIYFDDVLVNLIFGQNDTRQMSSETLQSGNLKICSKSIVFDPKDKLTPLIKIAFKDCLTIIDWPGNLESKYTNVLAVKCSKYIEMLNNNILAPYQFKNEKREFLFHFRYAQVDNYLNQLNQLHRAASLTIIEQNDMIATIAYSRSKRIKFNPLWLDDIYEKIINEYTVDEMSPLVLNPGRILLSSKFIYFQPYNNIKSYPVQKIPLKSISSIVKRRFLLRHTGLEINWMNDGVNAQLYCSFGSELDRNNFHKNVTEQESFVAVVLEPESMTLKWQNGVISNYDYLLYLNSLADRTFQDLTQYPIFPWIVCNYTSAELDLNDESNFRDLTKPIGALNANRLARLKERSQEMDNLKFLYGSHYSAPALVLFYLVRSHPRLMLCLQNGRFDHPDRMFNDINDTYNNCLTNMSDFKELVPEFYDLTKNGDFLLNKQKINFGCRHNGIQVNHVNLPSWSNGSAEIFVSKLRQALESDYVSRNLNHWIDLIFGYKQRGEESVKADNLFNPMCYEGAIDLDEIHDLNERHAMEIQISEFGQVPKQLFDKPHVPKLMTVPPTIPGCQNDESNKEDQADLCINSLDLYFQSQSQGNIINCVLIDGNNVFSTGKDGFLKCYNVKLKRQVRSVSPCGLPLSCCIKIANTNTVIIGSYDNTIMTYDLDYGRVLNVIPAHDDAVSCMSIIDRQGLLVSGSWDCSVKIWKGFNQTEKLSFRMSDALIAFLPLEEKISAIHTFHDDTKILIAIGTFDGEILLWTLNTMDLKMAINESFENSYKTLMKHSDKITSIQINADGTKMVSCGLDLHLQMLDLKTGMILFSKQLSHAAMCLNWSFDEKYLFVGDNRGKLAIWNMLNGSAQYEIDAFKSCINCISAAKVDKQIVVAGNDDEEFFIKIYNCN